MQHASLIILHVWLSDDGDDDNVYEDDDIFHDDDDQDDDDVHGPWQKRCSCYGINLLSRAPSLQTCVLSLNCPQKYKGGGFGGGGCWSPKSRNAVKLN